MAVWGEEVAFKAEDGTASWPACLGRFDLSRVTPPTSLTTEFDRLWKEVPSGALIAIALFFFEGSCM